MEWTQELVQSLANIFTSIACMGSMIGMILWCRSESRADYREIRQLTDAIHQEMKDFHGRLCAIEERKK